jgi:deazaflavin-dependent oxidoreductase (nitroreductase family)
MPSDGKPSTSIRLFSRMLKTRWMVRAPIWLYRARLGLLMGSRLLMLEHIGRTSGERRFVVLEVVERDAESFIVASGFGNRSQWYRNVSADPAVRVTFMGRAAQPAQAELLSPDESQEILARYAEKHPGAWAMLQPVMEELNDGDLEGGLPPLVRFVLT